MYTSEHTSPPLSPSPSAETPLTVVVHESMRVNPSRNHLITARPWSKCYRNSVLFRIIW